MLRGCMFRFLVGTFVACVSLLGCPVHKSWAQNPYRLGPGDVTEIRVRGYRELTGEYTLDESGRVRFRIAGYISLKGLTLTAARRLVQTKLSVHFRRLSSLDVRLKAKKKFVWVRGWVKKPGRLHLRWFEGIEVALQKAGGFRKGAMARELWLHEPGRKPRRLDMLSYYISKGKKKLPTIGRNAVIFVSVHRSQSALLSKMTPSLQNKAPFVAVFGAVSRPGLYPCLGKMELLKALALAGGPKDRAGLQEVLLARAGKLRWVDLRGWMTSKGKRPVPFVRAGDVVYIPKSPLGISGRGAVQLLGAVKRPGMIYTPLSKDLSQLFARQGGTRADANLHAITVITKGHNFTIKQRVNLPKILKSGRLDLLPPLSHQSTLVFVPPRHAPNQALVDAQNVTQIVLATASIVTTVILVVTTVNSTSK